MSALVTGVLLPSDGLLPLKIATFQDDDLSFLWQVVGGDAARVDLFQPAGTLYVNPDNLLPTNHRATLIMRAANPTTRGETVRGNAILVGSTDEDRCASVPPDYTDVLLARNGRFRVEFQSPAGGRRLPLSWPQWSEVFAAYREGLRLGRALPREAVRVVLAPGKRVRL